MMITVQNPIKDREIEVMVKHGLQSEVMAYHDDRTAIRESHLKQEIEKPVFLFLIQGGRWFICYDQGWCMDKASSGSHSLLLTDAKKHGWLMQQSL
jgi:hypothetical protein